MVFLDGLGCSISTENVHIRRMGTRGCFGRRRQDLVTFTNSSQRPLRAQGGCQPVVIVAYGRNTALLQGSVTSHLGRCFIGHSDLGKEVRQLDTLPAQLFGTTHCR